MLPPGCFFMSPGLSRQPSPHLQHDEEQHGAPAQAAACQGGDPSAMCRAAGEMAIQPENLMQCSVRKIQGPFHLGKMIKNPTPRFCLRTLYWWGGEGIAAASPGGHLCQWHQKLEKGGKNKLKILKSWAPCLTMRNFRISRLKSDLLIM